jgi:anti-sigma factor RsiW
MSNHVFDELAAYAENQLDETRRPEVERHLTACADCRRSLAAIQNGIALASQLTAEPMPADVAERIRSTLLGTRLGDRRESRSDGPRPWLAAAAVLLAGIAIGLYWHVNRPWIEMQTVATAPASFEAESLAVHDELRDNPALLTYLSDDEEALWQWLDVQGAPVTSMDIVRPEAERARFVPVGAAVRTLGGAQTSVLSYRIDGRPVTLALARAHEVAHAAPAGWWTKRVTHRRGPGGVNSLTWTVGGGTYVMASELDGAGQRACLICHTSAPFVEAVNRLTR